MTTPAVISLLPVAVVLLLGALRRPALNIFRVDARGLGHEHWTPRRAKQSLGDAIARGYDRLDRLRLGLMLALRHPFFKHGLAVTALLVAFVMPAAALPFAMGVLTEGQHTAEAIIWEATTFKRESITVLSGQNLTAGAVVGRVSKGIGRVSIPTVAGGTGTGTVSNVYAGPEVEVGSYVLTCTTAVADGGVFSLTTPSGKTLPSLTMTPGSGGTTNYRSRHINFTITDATDFILTNSFTFVVGTTAPTIVGATGTDTISALALGPDAKPGNYRVICTAAVSNGGVWQVYRGGPNGGESIGIFTQTPGSTTATAFETREISFTITDATDVIVGNYFDVCVFNNLSGGKVVAWDPTTYDGRNAAYGVLYAATDATSADKTGVLVARDAIVSKGALQWGAAITSSQKESAYKDLAARGVIAIDAATT